MTNDLSANDIRSAFNDITYDRPLSKIITGAKRRQHRRRVAVGAIPVLGLMAAWGANFLTPEELRLEFIECYDSGPDDPNKGVVTPSNTGGSPESVCAALWAGGHMGNEKGNIPPLKACVITRSSLGMKRGNVGVFPTGDDDFCSRPGLQPVPDGYLDRVEPFVAMVEDLQVRIRTAAMSEGGGMKEACLTQETAAAIVSDTLRHHGFDDWTVELGIHAQPAPCWTYVDLDSETKKAIIFPTDPGTKYIMMNGGTPFYDDW